MIFYQIRNFSSNIKKSKSTENQLMNFSLSLLIKTYFKKVSSENCWTNK